MMKRVWGLVVCALGIVVLGGCASYFKRKECNKVNWHQRGFDVAMSGKRLDSDSLIKECEKVEAEVDHSALDTGFKSGMAKYCEPESVLLLGREGMGFSADLCEGEGLEDLKTKYQEGLNEYCTPKNAFSVGTAGKVYGRVCTAEQEGNFLPEYRRGRRRYLGHVVKEKERRIVEIDKEVVRLQRQQSAKNFELMATPKAQQIVVSQAYDSVAKKMVERRELREDPEIVQRRQRIQWDIDDLSRRIQSLDSERTRLLDETQGLRTEIVALSPQTE